jgi:hypothetical protein
VQRGSLRVVQVQDPFAQQPNTPRRSIIDVEAEVVEKRPAEDESPRQLKP